MIRDRRFLPRVLFVCTSGKEGGEGIEDSENREFEGKPEEIMQEGREIGKLNLMENLRKTRGLLVN